MVFKTKKDASYPKSKAGLDRGFVRFFGRLRRAILSAVAEEATRASARAECREDADLFDRLPDPPPHLEIGDVKYFDGKFRYF